MDKPLGRRYLAARTGLMLGALLLVAYPIAGATGGNPEIKPGPHMRFLASDSLEGRLPGTPGARMASAYIADQFKASGLDPAFGESYFQDFEIELGIEVTEGPYLRIGNSSPVPAWDIQAVPISGGGGTAGRATDAVPGRAGDNDGNLEGALIFMQIPTEVEEGRWTMMGRDGLLEYMREQAAAAEGLGAVGVVFSSTAHGVSEKMLHNFPMRRSYQHVGIPVFEVSADYLPEMSQNASAGAGRCSLSVAIEPRKIGVRNVGGILKGTKRQDEYVVIGAHYDHLGYGDIASSTPWRREVHNGADDNASGVSALIEAANAMADDGPQERSVVFLAFTAEELGALGSEYFCKHPPFPIEKTVAMINLDTIGRMEDKKLIVFGARSAEEMSDLLAESNSDGLQIVEKKEIYGFSDQNPFYARGIPSLHLFTGAYDDYHSPDDDIDNIDLAGLATITEYTVRMTEALANVDQLTPVIAAEEPSPPEMSRGSGAFLGIVPDFAYSGTGVGLKGTVPESPAEAAGLQDGDVLVAIDGKPIADLRALMYFLAAGKPGDEIEIQIMRGSAPEMKKAVLSVRSSSKHSE